MLLSGSGDATLTNPAMAGTASLDPLLRADYLRELFRRYAGDFPLEDPRISPANGRLDRFAHVAMYVGTRDIFVHDAEILRDRLHAAGADVVFERYPGMPHDFMLMPVPEARRQVAHLVAALATVPRTGWPASAPQRVRG